MRMMTMKKSEISNTEQCTEMQIREIKRKNAKRKIPQNKKTSKYTNKPRKKLVEMNC